MSLFGSFNPFTYPRKLRAVNNALLAKYTFERLSPTDQRRVMAGVSTILANARYPIRNPAAAIAEMADRERFGFCALSMAMLGIAPALRGEGWFDVRNPYVDIRGADEIFESTRYQIRKKHGVEITL